MSILCGPFGPSIISVALSLVERIFFILSAIKNNFSSFLSMPLPFAFLYFLSIIFKISSSKRLPPSVLSPTDVIQAIETPTGPKQMNPI